MTSRTADSLNAALADRYCVERVLGKGGMATVYLAEDTRHHRKVAIKVLHAELSAVLGPERFLKEIELTAGLQHPHILPLFDSGRADGQLFYVMPYVEGETLRVRLERETQLPIDDAVRIAREVADALQYAHERGVVHRDIKPENILLHGGHALVADFGIALAVQQASGQRMTQTGLSVGTPQYMSPEQAMGERELDARSDVYALGCVTYEMLTGEPPFTGPTAQAIVAKVMTERPAPPSTVRDTVADALDQAVLRALAKLPADRFAGAADFAAALTSSLAAGRSASPYRAGGTAMGRSWRAPAVALGAGALALVVLAGVMERAEPAEAQTAGPVYESAILLPDSTPLAYIGAGSLGVGMPALAVSPDGGTLVFAGSSGGTTRLYVRPMDGSAVTLLRETEGAYAPFFSPDGRSVGFFVGGTLQRTSLKGGATVALASLVLPYGAVWLADGRILAVVNEGRRLVALAATGGAPITIGPALLPLHLVFPQPLPGDSAVLASTIDSHLAVMSTISGHIALLGPAGPIPVDSVTERTELFSGTNPRYLASGHLLYYSLDGAVMAMPFDPATHLALAPPVPVLSGVRLESIWGAAQMVVTRDGTLIYAPGENGRLSELVWRDHRGHSDTLRAFGRADYGYLDLSPDGARLLVRACTSQGTCAPHTLNLREGVRLSLRPDLGARNISAGVGWWDQGQRVFDFRARSTAASGMFTLVYAPEDPTRADSLPGIRVLDVAPDGMALYQRGDSLYVGRATAGLASSSAQPGFRFPELNPWGAQLRRGGEWVAYVARNEQAGDYVVFIIRTRPPYEHWRASPRGGEEPVWTSDGDLVYREGNRWMRVSAPSAPGARPGVARFLFAGPYLNVLGRSYDIAPDGRHLLVAGSTATTTTMLTMVTNWVTRLPKGAGTR